MVPVSATLPISDCRNSRRASGSRLATGSSSSSSRGRLASASASATWARCPPESLPTGRFGGMPSWASRLRASAPSQRRFSLPPMVTSSAAVKSAVQRGVLGDEPDLGQDRRVVVRRLRRRPGPCPRRARSRPTARCSSVLLPAPFGPTRAAIRPAGRLQRAVPQRPRVARTACPAGRSPAQCPFDVLSSGHRLRQGLAARGVRRRAWPAWWSRPGR